ncbi:uncharacterized protein [Panulirus ornatus]|uniref:uncharacterized protein isoform X1 n=2 Tax=Panulirus ornatus TaxID=150431 RepID=UPI003A851709
MVFISICMTAIHTFVTLFIHIYNLLTIHALLHMARLPRSTLSVPSFWQRYAYQIGRHTLHLDHMEHGILRGNRRHPTTGSVMFAGDDPRLALTLPADHRIHAALNCGALSCPALTWYTEELLDEQLDAAIHNLCNKGVNLTGQHITINSIFQWFSTDFAPTQSLTLRWLAECVEDADISRALQEAALGKQDFTFHYDWSLNAVSGVAGGRVKVAVYYEALCPDSKNFFSNQLLPAWHDLHDIIDLEFIPFGKAKATPTGTGDYHFQCQHGPHECHGNRVMSCAQNSLPITSQYQLFMCMMTKTDPSSSGKQCSEEVGINWAPIDECSTSRAGAKLLYANGIRTANLKPRVYFIPTITIDGHYSDHQLRSSLSDLKSQICAAYHGPPHQKCL